MKTKTIRQIVTFRAAPEAVYEALMDSRKHARFTGSPARISRAVGGTIMAYDGYVEGVNLELDPDRKIIQGWRASDWPEGHYSRATFTLRKIRGGTRLTLTHSGVPANQAGSIRQGWIDFYWEPMRGMLEKRKRR